MQDKYHPEIPAETKVQAILEVYCHRKTVKQTCQEYGISKQTYYNWEETAMKGMLQALLPQKKGRKKAEWIPPEKQEQEIAKLREKNRKIAVENRQLEQKLAMAASDLRMAKTVITDIWPEMKERKKKEDILRKTKRICSNIPDGQPPMTET